MQDTTVPTPTATTPATPATPFAQLSHYGGFDWAKHQHQVAVVDRAGTVLLELRFDNTAEGWAVLREKLAPFPTLGLAIETCCGPDVERLLAMGLAVFPLNPKAAERYRDRKRPGGAKDDPLDAWSFADALRTDGHAWRPLRPLDPATMELRLLCRDEITLIQQRTALANQLQAALHEYYPLALQAFDDWTAPLAWHFVVSFPTPDDLQRAGKRRWQKFLHAHRAWRPRTAERRLALFATATAFASPNPAVTAAKAMLATALAEQMLTLQRQIDRYRQRIEQLFDRHPDRDLFGSLPGAGDRIAPRLLAELGADRQAFDSPQALQCYAGTAPVTRRSGKRHDVVIRRSCNMTLRATVHLWADLSRATCVWAQAYYRQKRERGTGHAAALRCLGQRWLKILWRMWQDRAAYDEAKHTRNQVKHGSWVVTLLSDATTSQPAPQ